MTQPGARVAVITKFKELQKLLQSLQQKADDRSYNACHLRGRFAAFSNQRVRGESERAQQHGFANIVKGVFGMFRNPPAHAPKIACAVNREDAEEAFTLLSMIHKRIDAARTPARA
jgi:uncharacterized protein (TIGR02391 family)